MVDFSRHTLWAGLPTSPPLAEPFRVARPQAEAAGLRRTTAPLRLILYAWPSKTYEVIDRLGRKVIVLTISNDAPHYVSFQPLRYSR